MAFAQLTYRESLRDIETCLRALQPKLYHAGIRSKIARSTLAEANENRDWRIYADFAQVLIGRARKLYVEDDFGMTLKQTAYAFDSTTIDLCLSLFPWAQFRKRKGAIKIHTLMDLRGSIPCFIRITEGKIHDVNILDQLILEAGAFYILDRGYTDFNRLYMFTQHSAFFIIRAKSNLDYSRRNYRLVDKTTGLRSDQTILLKGPQTSQDYPHPLRRIGYFDSENRKRLVFLTNNFSLPPLTIAQLYKCRWQVELFFKWIKQHLRIKSFYGTSVNAVKTQIWIAISVYVLVAIVKKELNLDRSLNDILQILSITIFEKSPIYQVFSGLCSDLEKEAICNQLSLFNN
jgi:transposase